MIARQATVNAIFDVFVIGTWEVKPGLPTASRTLCFTTTPLTKDHSSKTRERQLFYKYVKVMHRYHKEFTE